MRAIRSGRASGARAGRGGRGVLGDTKGAAAAVVLCGLFGFGAIALSGVPSGAAASTTLYVDNVNGTQTTGCASSGANACKTIQEGVTVAQGMANTNVTLDVAGSSTVYTEGMTTVTINVPASDTLDIEGTGSTKPTLDNQGHGSNVLISTGSLGAVTIDGMTISGGNSGGTYGAGGGINDNGTGTLTVGNDTFSNNNATYDGGAIDAADACPSEGGPGTGDLVVNNTSFLNNTGTGGPTDGGAIDSSDCGGTGNLTVTNSTFQSNSVPDNGGAINAGYKATITNSTIASNSSGLASAVGSQSSTVSIQMVNDTLFGNSAPHSVTGAAKLSIANSILDDAPTPECNAAVTDNGHNVSSDNSCGLGANSVSNSTTIGTLTLGANGSAGPQTAAITTSSSAHGIVPASACTPNTDERGQPRPGLGYTTCDAGAFELQKSTGYDLAGTDGGVFVFPVGMPAGFYGSIPGLGIHINNIRGIVPINNYTGYDLAGSDGGVFVFPIGMPAGFYGSLPGLHISVNNVVGMVSTNSSHGYNLVGSDGGVFVFPTGQSAGYYGSLPGLGVHVNNIIGIVEQPDGGGYLLVGRDGGVFAFGDAKYYGSLPGSGITASNIVGISTTFDGKGYFLVGSDGSVYPFGDAVSHGSLPAMGIHVNNIVSVVPTADGGGYWLIGTDGGVFAFGNAGFIGSLPGLTPPVRVSNVIGAVPTEN